MEFHRFTLNTHYQIRNYPLASAIKIDLIALSPHLKYPDYFHLAENQKRSSLGPYSHYNAVPECPWC